MNPYRVHFVYLIPSDKNNTSESAILNAAKHLQAWYEWQMGNNKTFTLATPAVTVCNTKHDSVWYSTHDTGGDYAGWFWINSLQDLQDYAGGGFYQLYDDWVCYVDAKVADGQYAGGTSGGYTSGVAVLHEKDLASLRGDDPDWMQCRGVGGSGHEYGHTHGLPHPPPGPDFGNALMGTGYTIYPNCVLLDSDKATLDSNPFYQALPAQFPPPPKLCPFPWGRPTPKPKPKPLPRPRT